MPVEWLTSNPELAVVMGYSISLLMNEMIGKRLPTIGRWRIVEIGAVVTSIFYQFVVVSPSNGFESVFSSLTGALLFGVVAKEVMASVFGFN